MMRSATRRATLAVPSARSIVSTSSLPSSSRLLATHAAPGVTSAGHDFKADEHHDDHHHDDHHHEDGPTGYLWSRQVSAPPLAPE
jgi:ABC-type Zn2+ transport system substrate-binding protein/surface adhesin